MRVLDRSVYVGPSLYAHFPVIRLELGLIAEKCGYFLKQSGSATEGNLLIDGARKVGMILVPTSSKPKRLSDVYRVPGFRPLATLGGVFGDRKARVIALDMPAETPRVLAG